MSVFMRAVCVYTEAVRCMQDRCGIMAATMSVSVHVCSVCVPRPGVCRRTDVV